MKGRAISLLLFVAGVISIGQGGWIWAKAQLAQVLLEDAWSRSLVSGGHEKPWPWADTWPVARMSVPAYDAEMIVLAGANGEALAFGPGHVDGSAAPGARGNTIVSGHRDTHFRFLEKVKKDDIVVLQDGQGGVHSYHITATEVVDSRTHGLHLKGDASRLVLVTCWPFDAVVPGGPLRYVVYAEKNS